ncbi:MAG TPA: Ig-like domain-containing protein, partial [Candidatus Saccharimonadales bacterium]|nr:Ig-like domain-containing protein [Candidatus Saccharimonadales bacterium]
AILTGGVINPAGILQIDTLAPTVASVVPSGAGITAGAGALNAGKIVTLTLNMTEAVTVAGGTPTLTLNDGGVASYVSGSGTSALVFNYTVAAGQTASDLTVTAVNLNAATVADLAGNAAVLTGAMTNPAGILQIDTTLPGAPAITGDSITANAVTLTGSAEANSTVTVLDGVTTLGTAITNSSGAWTYTTIVLASGNHNFTATATDAAGNTGATSAPVALTLGTPIVSSMIATPGTAAENAGKVVILTMNLTSAVNVTGIPTLTLNDGGTATYVSGSGSGALVFSYTVAAGQNTSALAITGVNLPGGATIQDSKNISADLTGAVTAFAGLQIDTTAPLAASITGNTINANAVTLNGSAEANSLVTIYDGATVLNTITATAGGSWTYTTAVLANGAHAFTAKATDAAGNVGASSTALNLSLTTPSVSSVVASPSTADYSVGAPITITLTMNEAVTVSGGIPTLTLNDGGSATYTSGSGTSTLTFTYTVAAGQNTSALAITGSSLSGASIKDSVGNNANLAGVVQTFSGVQIDTTAPATPIITSQTINGNVVTFTGTGPASTS